METKLTLIAKRSKEDRACKFNNLMHLINEKSLRESFTMLKRGKAPGVDRMTLEEYEKDLDAHIDDLITRMKKMQYRPQPVRGIEIPKGNGKTRPLGIPTVEDKMVQMAFKRILEAIYEADFLELSYGFRKGKNAHQALAQVDQWVMNQPIDAVIDADIKGFFDNVNHGWIVRCLEERISDQKFIRYIVRMLKSGVMREEVVYDTTRGTPQGGVISPILANIYLHYVLDLWFTRVVKQQSRRVRELVRYCDDFIILVESEEEAQHILSMLQERLAKFGLELSQEKTRIVRFGRRAQREHDEGGPKPGSFNFLGFTHVCSKSRRGTFKVGRRTQKERYKRSLLRVKTWLRRKRSSMPLREIHKAVSRMMVGHFQYYGVSENSDMLGNYRYQVEPLLFKWLNRRSQKRSFTWEKFNRYLRRYPLPRARIYHSLYHHAC